MRRPAARPSGAHRTRPAGSADAAQADPPAHLHQNTARAAFRRLPRLRIVAGLLVGMVFYAASIQAALPPGAEAEAPAAMVKAGLRLEGADAVITGSVGTLFTAKVFSGPNRAEKRARARPAQDAIAVASTFNLLRSEMLTQRLQPELVDFLRKSRRSEALPLPTALAAIDPTVLSAALSAIEKTMVFDPIPDPVPATLAYARAMAPPSIFDTPVSMKVSERQFECLAEAVYFESRGEAYRGQVAVAQVVLNRVKSDLYPSSICAVVYQNQSWRNACQFSFACDGIPERVTEPEAWATAREVATKVLRGDLYLTEVANATHYHASYVRPVWARQMKKMTSIGLHVFYRFKGVT